MKPAATLTYDEYQSASYFSALDGVRAVSVVMVMLWHMRSWNGALERLNGWTGVTVFFVLSGFLITTLCLRESARAENGRFAIGGFYIRRAFRILPLYALTVLFATLVFQFGRDLWILNPPVNFWQSMGYYLTLSVDLIHDRVQPLGHLWSVGVEEKFYVLWPLALLLLLRLPRTARTAICLLMITQISATGYSKLYLGIMLGCLLAFALDDPRTYAIGRWVASLGWGVAFVLAFALLLFLQPQARDMFHGAQRYAYVAFVVIGLLVLRGRGMVAGALSSGPARWIGRRSYAIYLFHPFAIHGIEPSLGHDDSSIAMTLLRMVLAFTIAFVAADLAHRFIEVPMIRRGRRIAAALAAGAVGAPAGTPTATAA